MINWTFIETLEGTGRTKGYVPENGQGKAIDQSGVTIACGVDLGQMSRQEIIGLVYIDTTLKTKLSIYAGKRGADAIAILAQYPLELTSPECNALSVSVQSAHATKLGALYAQHSHATFESIPGAAQTVLTSVSWQYGLGLPERTPRFWTHMIDRDWMGAIHELRNFGDEFPQRRAREADYMAAWLGDPDAK